MHNTLKDLWFSYLSTISIDASAREKEILDTLISIEGKLTSEPNQIHSTWLEKYVDGMGEVRSIAEQRAFEEGVRFTAKFLIEALWNK